MAHLGNFRLSGPMTQAEATATEKGETVLCNPLPTEIHQFQDNSFPKKHTRILTQS